MDVCVHMCLLWMVFTRKYTCNVHLETCVWGLSVFLLCVSGNRVDVVQMSLCLHVLRDLCVLEDVESQI